MLNLEKSANEIWETVDCHISHWLGERQTLISSYCDLSGVRAYTKSSAPSYRKLQAFCEQLVDYVSKGHFAIYQELQLEAQAFHLDQSQIQKIYPKIEITTEVALEFNDKYDVEPEQLVQVIATLTQDLSKLGVAIALRLELEDQLIDLLHKRNSKEVA
ncbi:MAG: sigma D regulator [Pseudomonadales bacterium]|nr:sigma D regulator [Pseudomonadales bacterium]